MYGGQQELEEKDNLLLLLNLVAVIIYQNDILIDMHNF